MKTIFKTISMVALLVCSATAADFLGGLTTNNAPNATNYLVGVLQDKTNSPNRLWRLSTLTTFFDNSFLTPSELDGNKGDIDISGAGGDYVIINGAVTYAKLQDISATQRLLGRNNAGPGVAQEVTLSQLLDWIGSAAQGDILYRGASSWSRLAAGTSGHFLQTLGAGANPQWAASGGVSDGDKGDITASSSGATWTIDNAAVTLAKMANLSAPSKLIGRFSGGAGVPQEITISTGLSLDGSGNLTASGSATAWDAIGDAGGNGSISFGATTQTITSTLDDGNPVLTLQNTDIALANATPLLRLKFYDSNASANSQYLFLTRDDGAPVTDYIFAANLMTVNPPATFNGGVTSKVSLTITGAMYYTWTDISSTDIDCAVNASRYKMLTGNTTFTFSNTNNNFDLIVELQQDAAGTRTVTWPGNIHWKNSTNPAVAVQINTNALVISTYHFYRRNGTNFCDGPTTKPSMFDAELSSMQGGNIITNDAYSSAWDGVTAKAPSQNAVYDKIESIGAALISDTAYASSWNGVTTVGGSKNAIYDWGHTFDTDEDGKVNVLDMGAGLVKTDSGGVVSAATAGADYATHTSITNIYEFALSDETTAITTGTAKLTWRAPHAMTIKDLRASLTTVSSSGIPTVDINEGGTTIISTKLTIDANEKTSTTAAAAYVLSDSSIADDAEITFDIDVAGTGATGLKVKIYYTR
jgi:uncharacterized protein DUF5907